MRIERDGKVLFSREQPDGAATAKSDEWPLSIAAIHEFATQAPLEDISFILEAARLNEAVALEGLAREYGLQVGRTIDGNIRKHLMREDVLDLLTFDPAPDRQALIGASGAASDSAPAGSPLPMAVEVRAPGWKLLGHTRPTGQPPLDAERVWITWRAGA